MKKILILALGLFISTNNIWALDFSTYVDLSSLKFKTVVWDNSYKPLYFRTSISDHTRQQKAVILYLFNACMT